VPYVMSYNFCVLSWDISLWEGRLCSSPVKAALALQAQQLLNRSYPGLTKDVILVLLSF